MFLLLDLSGLSNDPKASMEEGVKCIINLVHQSPICRRVFLNHSAFMRNLCQSLGICKEESLRDFYVKLSFLLTGHSVELARVAIESGLLDSLTEVYSWLLMLTLC